MAKMSDLELVKQLEKETGEKLKQVPLLEIGEEWINAFSVAVNGHVKGLSICSVKLTGAAAILSKFQQLSKKSAKRKYYSFWFFPSKKLFSGLKSTII